MRLLACLLFAGPLLYVSTLKIDQRIALQGARFHAWVNESSKAVQKLYIYSCAAYCCALGGTLLLMFLASLGIFFWFFIWPPYPAARAAAWLIFINLVTDVWSAKVTHLILKRVATGHTAWGLLGPPLDVLSALLIKFGAVFAMLIVLSLTGFYSIGYQSRKVVFLVQWMSYSVLIPTIMVAVAVLLAWIYKAIQEVMRHAILIWVDHSISETDETYVRPFFALASSIVIATWLAFAFSKSLLLVM